MSESLCPAFRDIVGRTFRCLRPNGPHVMHYGLSGQQRNSWMDGSPGAYGALFVPSDPPSKIAPDYLDPDPLPKGGDIYAGAPRPLIPSLGGKVYPYPDSKLNLAVPQSGVEPQEPPFDPDAYEEPGVIQEPYVEPYVHDDT